MGRYLAKMMFLVLTSILLLPLLISSSTDENGVCISKSADVELMNLNLCGKVFHGKKTTCSASQMQSASLAVENLATYGEADQDCLDLFELLECSICHQNVGIQSPTLHVCASFCESVFEACSDAYFSSIGIFGNNSKAIKQVIVPCGEKEGIIICGKASKWEFNGTAFCDAAGFTVQTADDFKEEEPCYGSNSSLEPVMKSESSEDKTEKVEWLSNATKQFIVPCEDSDEEPCYGSNSSLEPVKKSEWREDKTEMVKLFKLVNKQLITCVIGLVLKGIMIFIRRLEQQDMMAAMNQDAGNMNGNA